MNLSPKQLTLVESKQLLKHVKTGTLASIDFENGAPFASWVNIGLDERCHHLFLLSGLARHTRCISQDPRVSLLVAPVPSSAGDPLTACRLTISGRVEITSSRANAERYLSRHEYSRMYADFGDFHFWLLLPEQVYVVGGFGNIFRYAPEEFFNESNPI
jgi:putative heme iron utilization protein